MYEDELARKYPQQVATAAAVAEAVEVIALTLKTTGKAVENELLAAGSTVQESPEPTPAKAWA